MVLFDSWKSIFQSFFFFFESTRCPLELITRQTLSTCFEHFFISIYPFRCPKCVMVCYRRANFTRHLTARHGFSQLSASQLSKSMENKLFKSFKRRIVGGSSRAGGHVTVTESLKCPHCSYLAKWPSDLRRHMQVN